MNTRPRLTRSIPFWGLVVGSVASVGFGVWLTIDKLTVMETKLLDGTATGVEVYGGQVWAIFAAAFVCAGLVGLVAALALGAARTFAVRPVEPVEAIDWQREEPDVETHDESPVADIREPAVAPETDPVFTEPTTR
jgi:hypothetical protein